MNARDLAKKKRSLARAIDNSLFEMFSEDEGKKNEKQFPMLNLRITFIAPCSSVAALPCSAY